MRSSTWLQAHVYAGLFACFVFVLHVDRLQGGFERVFAGVFFLTALSGVLGLYLTRAIPPRLRTRGREVIYERIPGLMRKLRIETEDMIVRSVEQTGSRALADYYARHLFRFFALPRHRLSHLMERREPVTELQKQMDNLTRYIGEDERVWFDELAAAVATKHDLDYHYALQSLLKHWLFVHIPLSYVLGVMMLLHVLAVTGFSGGLPG